MLPEGVVWRRPIRARYRCTPADGTSWRRSHVVVRRRGPLVLTVGELMCRAAAHNADRMAVISGDRRLTFAQAWTRGIRLANALLEMGLRPGDRVGVLEDNSLESQDFFAGAAIANLARVPLYGRDSRQAHAHNLGHTNCR